VPVTASTQGSLRYLPIDGRPQRMTLGLRPLDLDDWLDVDDQYAADLDEKRRLLRDRHSRVVAHRPAGDAGSAETLALISGWLAQHHPGLAAPPDSRLHPIDAAGRLVQEDLCLLVREAAGWVLGAASVCFPSRWDLAAKIGRSVSQIHGPVPDYAQIEAAVDQSMDRLSVERPRWRLNWTILPAPELHQPPAPSRTPPEAYPGLDGLWFRVERQTLRRLPVTGAVLFTIRTYRAPLAGIVADPVVAADLAATLRTVDPAHAGYKGWQQILDPLLADLAQLGDTRATRHGASNRPAG
jgi:dimethylamine monooxygenase subunit A